MKARCPRCAAPLPVVGAPCLKCAKLREVTTTRLACAGLAFVLLCLGAVAAQIWRIKHRPPAPEEAEPEEFTRDVVGSPPALVDSAVFVPRFQLRDGSTGSGGHAFVARHPALPGPVVLSILGLLGPVLQLPAQVDGASVGDELSRLWLLDPATGLAVADVTSAGIGLPGTAPLGRPSPAGDVLACWPPRGAELGVLPLTSRLTQRGSIVWLAAQLEDGGEVVLTPARLIEIDEHGFLRYEFADAIDPSVLPGAPLLDQTGVVVAVHAGGGVARGHDGRPNVPFGLGTAIGTFIRPLVKAIQGAQERR